MSSNSNTDFSSTEYKGTFKMKMNEKQARKCFVSWFNRAEWFAVFNLIYGENNDALSQQKALRMLKVWKSRIPSLHSGVEGTLIILGAVLLDKENMESYDLRLIQSTSVMRFLNICAANDKHQGNFYQLAKKRHIPEWIISLRHDAAHSQNLPTADILNKALKFCLQWLYQNYWLPVSSTLHDYVDTFSTINMEYEDLKSSLEPFVMNYVYVNVVLHPKWNYVTIGSIPDLNVRTSVQSDLSALLSCEEINDGTKLTEVLHKLWLKIERKLQLHFTKRKLYILPELLVENDIFLGNMDDYEKEGPDSENRIPKSFLFLWEKLLKSMHNFGMMPEFLEKLLEIVQDEGIAKEKKRTASLWLAELGRIFKKCILAQNIYKTLPSEVKSQLSAGQLQLKLKYECEQQEPPLKHVLTLGLLNNIPNMLTNIELFKKHILNKPTEFSSTFLPGLLEICDGFKNDTVKEKILELTDVYTNITLENALPEIHTVEDIAKIDSKSEDQPIPDSKMEVSSCSDTESRWKLVTDIDFGTHPIGILPWQSVNTNPLLSI